MDVHRKCAPANQECGARTFERIRKSKSKRKIQKSIVCYRLRQHNCVIRQKLTHSVRSWPHDFGALHNFCCVQRISCRLFFCLSVHQRVRSYRNIENEQFRSIIHGKIQWHIPTTCSGYMAKMRLANFGDEMLSELIEFFIHSAVNRIRSTPSHHKLKAIHSIFLSQRWDRQIPILLCSFVVVHLNWSHLGPAQYRCKYVMHLHRIPIVYSIAAERTKCRRWLDAILDVRVVMLFSDGSDCVAWAVLNSM